MRGETVQRFGGWVVVFACVLWATPAAAQDRVAVTGFFGPSSGATRSAVARVMSEGYEVVDAGTWNAAAKRVGNRGNAARRTALVANQLGVKAVVSGGVRRVRRAWAVAVVIRDGGNGEILGRRSTTIRAPGRAAAAAGSLARDLMAFIDEAQGASGDGAPPPDEDTEDESPPDDQGGDDVDMDFANDVNATETERPPGLSSDNEHAGQADDTELPIREEEGRRGRRRHRERDQGDDTEREPSHSTRHGNPLGFLDVSLEIDITQRSFEVGINPLCDYRDRPRNLAILKTGVYSEIGFGFAFYPGALFSDRWWSNLGVEFLYRHHLVLKIVNETQGESVDASEQNMGVGLVYRAAFHAGSRVISLFPRIGWGRYSFFLGSENNDLVPPFDYDHVYLGLNSNIPLYRTRLELSLGIHYLAMVSIGSDAVTAYNGSGRLPSSHGVEFNVGFSGQIFRGLRWLIGFELNGFFTENQGKGRGWGSDPENSTLCDSSCAAYVSCSDPTTGDPVVGGIETAGAAHDLIWRLVFQLSYRLGWHPEDLGGRRSRSPDRTRSRDDDDSNDEPMVQPDEADEFEVVDEGGGDEVDGDEGGGDEGGGDEEGDEDEGGHERGGDDWNW